MTNPAECVESPLANANVQRTIASIVVISVTLMMIVFSLDRSSVPLPAGLTANIRMDLNEANANELSLVPGVGPVLAKRIIADRIEHGDFCSVDESQRVYGIGPRTLENLRTFCFVSAIATDDRVALDDR